MDWRIYTLQGTDTYPTWGSSENHRLKSALGKGYVIVPWRVAVSTFSRLLSNDATNKMCTCALPCNEVTKHTLK